ncbi:MAG: LpxI family protein [Acidobacteriota bacterium]
MLRRLGLIAGNGRFPFLVLEEARKKGIAVVVAAIKEETFPEIEEYSQSESGPGVSVHWIGLGQLGKLIRTFKKEKIDKVVMAGQVRHVQIFAPRSAAKRRRLTALPDLKMWRLLKSLPHKNTESLIAGVAAVLEREGIELLDSTLLLRDLLPEAGVLTKRGLTPEEVRDIEYGRPLARELARLDLGQTLVVKDQAVVAIEAMEGTDETIRRAARLVKKQRLTVIKVSRPRQDMRFDVPVVGIDTLGVLGECHVSAMAIDARRTLILDRAQFIQEADRLGISLVAG